MTVNYTTNNFTNIDNSQYFKGVIYLSDFDTTHAGSRNMATRIAKDWRFDQFCYLNSEARKRQEDYKKGRL